MDTQSVAGARRTLAAVAIAHALLASAAAAPEPHEVLADRSRAVVEVGKSGPLSFIAGHTHRVEAPIHGRLTLDPAFPEGAAVSIEIRARDLTVSADGEPPEDVPKIQETMAGEKVLDVERYPTIAFESTAIAVRQRGSGTLDLAVTGLLTLHGRTNPVEVPVRAEVSSGAVAVRGALSVKQSDYGITPVRVGGGVVSVKDTLQIAFTIVAAPRSSDLP